MPFLGGVHLFDWDEINFSECAREMILMEDYLRVHVNFEPFWEKPPFFFWMQALSMHIWGINEYAARFPNAVCGVITLILIFNIGEKLYDKKFGMIWAGAYLGSILPHLYFKSAIIDPFFNLFIFLALYFFILFYWQKESYSNIQLKKNKLFYLIVGGLILGLAILTKGPVAYLIICLTLFVYWILQYQLSVISYQLSVISRLRLYIFSRPFTIPQFILFSVVASLIMLTWYGLETLAHGPWFVIEFTKYQYRLFSTPDAGHKGFLGYHFVVLLIGCFPASVFAIRSFFKQTQQYKYQKDFKRWMLIFFWVVLILFSIVQSKIVHYSSLCYFPLTYLAGLTVYQILQGKINFNRWMKFGLISIGSLFSLVTIALPFLAMKPHLLKPLFSNDPFAQANLEANVHWTGWEALVGIFLFIIVILSIYFISKKKAELGFKILFSGMAVFVMSTLIFFAAKIELYSQGAAIRFYQSLEGKDCYVETLDFKSYGHLFYAKKQVVQNEQSRNQDWLLNGDIDKPAYFVCKNTKADRYRKMPQLKELKQENGFVFFKRSVNN